MLRRYTFKLYPNKEHKVQLAAASKKCAILWNTLLKQRERHFWTGVVTPLAEIMDQDEKWEATRILQCDHHVQKWRKSQSYQEYRKTPEFKALARERFAQRAAERKDRAAYNKDNGIKSLTSYDQHKEITRLRADRHEWAELPVAMLRGEANALDDAFKAFFKRAKEGAGKSSGYPKYKRVDESLGFKYTDKSGWLFSKVNNRFLLKMKGIGSIKARGKIPGTPQSFKTPSVMFRDGLWFVSVVMDMEPRRHTGTSDCEVDLNLIDDIASVKQTGGDSIQTFDPMPELARAKSLTLRADRIKADRDTNRKNRSYRFRRDTNTIASLLAKAARIRKYTLHLWTTSIVNNAKSLHVLSPPIKAMTQSARGDEYEHGAAVDLNASINRNTLNFAPAMAVQMFEYKAEEAGTTFTLTRVENHDLSVGKDLSDVTKAVRKVRRAIRKEKDNG